MIFTVEVVDQIIAVLQQMISVSFRDTEPFG